MAKTAPRLQASNKVSKSIACNASSQGRAGKVFRARSHEQRCPETEHLGKLPCWPSVNVLSNSLGDPKGSLVLGPRLTALPTGGAAFPKLVSIEREIGVAADMSPKSRTQSQTAKNVRVTQNLPCLVLPANLTSILLA